MSRYQLPKMSLTYAPANVMSIILHSTFVAVIVVSILSTLYPLLQHTSFDAKNILVLCSLFYLFFVEVICRFDLFRLTAWMLIGFYSIVASIGFILWGTEDTLGIFTACFAIILSGVILGTTMIFPVTITVVCALVVSHFLHSFSFETWQITVNDAESWNILLYATALHILALVSWLSYTQLEHSIRRAQLAEEILRQQKASIKADLLKETTTLRNTQLDHIHQLHKFALLGQSAAATLHELSNLLSILSLDISDLRQQHTHSKAIENATASIESINKMVRSSRQQLDSYDENISFDASKVIQQIMKDFRQKISRSGVTLSNSIIHNQPLPIKGSPLALMQVFTILLHNALEACAGQHNAKVSVTVNRSLKAVEITLSDNGPGIDPMQVRSLFVPKVSTKPTGLGVGLYIAHHIVTDHFKGVIQLLEADEGAHFLIQLPLWSSPEKLNHSLDH